ncbi:MAG: hypothetical protein ABSB78_14770 [Bacteroidota bacterium]|jgi:hypothetical protein
MSKKKKKERQSIWSNNMLKEFRNLLLYMPVPEINFVIKERSTWVSLTNMSEKHSISFLGESIGFEDVYIGLNALESSTEEYRDYMGYIEILNGVLPEEQGDVPLIRVIIKKDIAFFESLSKMAIESRILNQKRLIALNIQIDASNLKDIPAESMLNIKLPIRSVSIFQRDSFV